ncbi:unnamed protein product [Trichobilharzia szidati]|nr:unnamed protein product [Trichobilharzia szidati]
MKMSTRRNFYSLSGRKSHTHEKSGTQQHSWKNFYRLDGDPIGRGYAGKVYKVFADNINLLEISSSDYQNFSTIICSENYFAKPGEYFACKAIRRFRGGKDTFSKITSEIRAMINLQSYSGHYFENNNLACTDSFLISIQPGSRMDPPKSASPKLFAVHEDSLEVAIVMEYAHGGSLYDLCGYAYRNCSISTSPKTDHQFIKSLEDGLPEVYVCQLLVSILEALMYMHESLKMVHLDVKAENVLLRQPYPSTDVFLTDFGLATVLTEGKQHRELAGTPDYVAPEIINYDPITFATDMWSVGVLTYYLLTGISPFLGEDKMITMQNITHATITYPDELFKHRSSNSIDFIQHLLQRSPKRRMSARECLNHPWLQSIQTNANVKDIQSNELLQSGNFSELSSSDKCNLNHPLELCYAEPIFELSDELLSAFSLSFFTLETPVHITPRVNPIAQNIIINSLSEVYANHPEDMKMYSSMIVGLTNLMSNIHANRLSSLDIEPVVNQYSLNLSKNLINGHFNLLKVLSTTTTTTRPTTEKSCPVNRVHYYYNYCNYNLAINTNDKNDDDDGDSDSSTEMLPLMPLSSTIIPPTVQLPIKYLSNSFTNCDADNLYDDDIYASSSLFVLRLIQAYSMLSTIYDLNYNNLLSYDCDTSNYTTDTITSSSSNITNNITYSFNSNNNNNRVGNSHPMSNIDPLLADSFHSSSNKMTQTNREVSDEDLLYAGVKKTPIKVSQYTIDTLPKVDECILPRIVKSHISTVCIQLKSPSGQYKIVINPLENNNNNRYNHSWENSSIDFSIKPSTTSTSVHLTNKQLWSRAIVNLGM